MLLRCESLEPSMSLEGQTLPSCDFCDTAALPLRPDIGWRGWHGRKVPKAAVSNCSKATHYSITSSASASNLSGIWMPSAFAVFKLITRTWSTVRPAGQRALHL
jgi:hypothetical protein